MELQEVLFDFKISLSFLSVENVALEYRNITVGDAMICEPVSVTWPFSKSR